MAAFQEQKTVLVPRQIRFESVNHLVFFFFFVCGGSLEMIKRPVCRKLPGDLSIFLNQPQMVHSSGCNTRKLCY